MERVVERSIPKCHDAIAHIFIDGTLVRENGVGHRGQIAVQEGCQTVRIKPFGYRRKAANVAKHNCQLAQFTAKRQSLWVLGEMLHDRWSEITAERVPDMSALGFG